MVMKFQDNQEVLGRSRSPRKLKKPQEGQEVPAKSQLGEEVPARSRGLSKVKKS